MWATFTFVSKTYIETKYSIQTAWIVVNSYISYITIYGINFFQCKILFLDSFSSDNLWRFTIRVMCKALQDEVSDNTYI